MCVLPAMASQRQLGWAHQNPNAGLSGVRMGGAQDQVMLADARHGSARPEQFSPALGCRGQIAR